MNQRLEYGVGRRLGVCLSTAAAVASVNFSTVSSSAGLVFISFHGPIHISTSAPIVSQSARSYTLFALVVGLS
jgi:hypothetical protein